MAALAGAVHVLVILVLLPEVWRLRGVAWGSGWPGQAVEQEYWAGITLGGGGRGPGGTVLPENDFVAWGAMLHSILAWG